MPVTGPTYSDETVNILYEKCVKIIENKGILNYKPIKSFKEEREKRMKNLKESIRALVELDSWESF